MTDATAPELYPQYCFHLSPTINRWCHLRIADIQALTSHPGFQGQDVYFHLNHPIKWVRASGVVVAIDEWEARHIYTLDDGSGATIQCVVNLPRPAPGAPRTTTITKSNPSAPPPKCDAPIDVGHVLDIKGSVTTFRDAKNIRAEKIVHLRSTEQEVGFWEKVAGLRREVLCRPWVLDRREVRRCRREEEGRGASRRQRVEGGGKRQRVTGLERKREMGVEKRWEAGLEIRGVDGLGRQSEAGPERKETGLERRSGSRLEAKGETVPGKRRATGLERRSEAERNWGTGLENRRVTGLEKKSETRLGRAETKPEKTRVTGLESKRTAGLEVGGAGPEERRVTGLESRKAAGLMRETGLEKRFTGLENRNPRVTGLESKREIGLERTETRPESRRVTGLERKRATGLEATDTRPGKRRITGLESRRDLERKGETELKSETASENKDTRLEKRRVTGLERRAKPVTRVIPVRGKYDALGL